MMIYESQRKISLDQIAAGHGPSVARRLGIPLAPVHGIVCHCDKGRAGCTCKLATPTRDAKPRPGIGHPHLIAAVLALKDLDRRLTVQEQRLSIQKSAPQG